MVLDFLQKKLDERVKNGNLRKLPTNGTKIDFVSNDYLGLAQNRELAERITKRLEKESPQIGGTGSRLLSGNHPYYEELEDRLKVIFQAEGVLVFNSGYAANQALVSSVAEKGDTILYDQLSHVCLKEGAWLSKADTQSFRHNDLDDLKRRISQSKGRVFVLTETIFSMDGDVSPLEDLVELCEQSGAYLIVDEAHSTGLYGSKGEGMVVFKGLQDRVFARVYTFGKAMGVHGACVAGAQVLVDYLVNFARPFIYTTSMPPHSVISIIESFGFLAEGPHLDQKLENRIGFFRNHWEKSLSQTAIQPVMVGSNEQAKKLAAGLQEAGFDIRPILAPTVRKGTERLRISLHVHNTQEEILSMIHWLKSELC